MGSSEQRGPDTVQVRLAGSDLTLPICGPFLYFPPHGQVAQLVEQRTENPRVGGSIPSLAIKHHKDSATTRTFLFHLIAPLLYPCTHQCQGTLVQERKLTYAFPQVSLIDDVIAVKN